MAAGAGGHRCDWRCAIMAPDPCARSFHSRQTFALRSTCTSTACASRGHRLRGRRPVADLRARPQEGGQARLLALVSRRMGRRDLPPERLGRRELRPQRPAGARRGAGHPVRSGRMIARGRRGPPDGRDRRVRRRRLGEPRRRAGPLLLALSVGLVLSDSSVVTLALPSILREFDSTVSEVAWVLIAFNLALTVAACPAGSPRARTRGCLRAGERRLRGGVARVCARAVADRARRRARRAGRARGDPRRGGARAADALHRPPPRDRPVGGRGRARQRGRAGPRRLSDGGVLVGGDVRAAGRP